MHRAACSMHHDHGDYGDHGDHGDPGEHGDHGDHGDHHHHHYLSITRSSNMIIIPFPASLKSQYSLVIPDNFGKSLCLMEKKQYKWSLQFPKAILIYQRVYHLHCP